MAVGQKTLFEKVLYPSQSSMNPYKILGITDQASDEEVKRAYRAMAAKYHPDVGGDAWVFEQVRDAYDRIVKIRQPAAQATARPTKTASATPEQKPQRAAQQKSAQQDTAQQRTQPPNASHPNSTRAASPQSTSKQTASAQPTSAADNFNANTATWPALIQTQVRRLFTVFFRHQLPLQSETSYFILANVLDIVFTNILLRMHAIEANPIANYVLIHWGFNGMIAFKLFLVACVCLVTQLIAVHHLRRARQTLYLGTAIVGAVVIYSGLLLVRS